MSILDTPVHILFNQPLNEVVLRLWQENTGAGTILSLCKIDEDELDKIVPRSLWNGVAHSKCPRCSGSGFLTRIVPWERDDWYYPKIEAAKLLDWQQVAKWNLP